MIERYTDPDIERIWNNQDTPELWARYQRSVLVERAESVVEPQEAPPEILEEVRRAPVPGWDSVVAREATTGHDVVAFLDLWTRQMSPEAASWVHRGLTSSDMVDSIYFERLTETSAHLSTLTRGLQIRLERFSEEWMNTPRLGRTHGQAAEVTTLGYQWLTFARQAGRALDRLDMARRNVQAFKASGPVGTWANVPPDIDGSEPARQVIARDRVLTWASAVVEVVTLAECIATEIRLGSQYGIEELAEGGARTGSSAMPVKRNPVTSEKICGYARLARGYWTSIAESVALWNDRDISHSSVERVAVVDLAHIAARALNEINTTVSNLVVDSGRMYRNLDNRGLQAYSAIILDTFLEVIPQHRYEAHETVRRALEGPPLYDFSALVFRLVGDGHAQKRAYLRRLLRKRCTPEWALRWVMR